MNDVNIIIDGHEIKGLDGVTILEAAPKNGIEIPTLCHSPQLTPTGVCRACVTDMDAKVTQDCFPP